MHPVEESTKCLSCLLRRGPKDAHQFATPTSAGQFLISRRQLLDQNVPSYDSSMMYNLREIASK
jgi:hypothetical protein